MCIVPLCILFIQKNTEKSEISEQLKGLREQLTLLENKIKIADALNDASLWEKKKIKKKDEKTGESVIYNGVRQILDEMVYNICENAIKYNKECGEIRVWVGSTLNGKKIIVTDTGIGIPKNQQERIFERFYRVDKSHSKEIGGTGLGLSIVKHGAILHNAKIHVDSELGKRTRMELTF